MRTRRRLTWIIFAVCILAVLEGLGWVTWRALRLERREREAQAQAQFQQSIRLALWRMESQVTPLIAAEAARPYFHYIPFYAAERAYTKMFQQVKPNEVLVPSPLLEASGRFIRLHYQVEPDGVLTSPQAPTGNMRDLAEAQYLDSEYIVLAGQLLHEVETMIHPARAAVRLEPQTGSPAPQVSAPPGQTEAGQVFQQWQIDDNEYKARERAVQSAQTMNLADNRRKSPQVERSGGVTDAKAPAEAMVPQVTGAPGAPAKPAGDSKAALPMPAPTPPAAPAGTPPGDPGSHTANLLKKESTEAGSVAPDRASGLQSRADSALKDFQEAARPEGASVEQSSFSPRWLLNPSSGEEELLLERTVTVDGKEVRQGLWMDWPALRQELTGSVSDLLSAATLTPSNEASNDATGLRLAALPVRLLPGSSPPPQLTMWSATNITLVFTWAAVLSAIAAIAIVLRKAMELSERRGRFVSAVTHELRTPLTTFCLYTEMLADGMVGDDGARREYLGTLKRESGRLARIVQNVLDYAGIGGVARRPSAPSGSISAAALVDRVSPALRLCAERSGMTLVTEVEGIQSLNIRVDPQTVERILLNLVENAGKYASDASDKRIHFVARPATGGGREWLELSIRDHGPGVPKSERRRIFQAFHRAERDAQSTKSGLGLGLALARELASELGGKLQLNAAVLDGAEFTIRLPADT